MVALGRCKLLYWRGILWMRASLKMMKALLDSLGFVDLRTNLDSLLIDEPKIPIHLR